MKNVDIGVGIGLLILCSNIFWYAGSFKGLTVHGYGPDLFPRVLAVFMSFLAILLIINAFLGKSLEKEDYIDPKGFLRVLVAIGICIVYLVLVNLLGFVTSTFLFLFVLMALLKQERIILRTISSVTVSVIVWAIFRYFLVIPLPDGLLI